MDNIYPKVAKLAEENGISLYRLAKDTDLPNNMLYEWKAGKATPKVDKVIKIADYFGVPLDHFYRD